MSATLEEVQEAAVGTKVLVQGVEWSRVDGGLSNAAGSALALDHFRAWFNAGSIELGPWWELNRWYLLGETRVLVTHRHDQQIHVLTYPVNAVTAIEADWPESPQPAGLRLTETANEELWMKRVRHLYSTLIREAPLPLVDTLHEYARSIDDEEFDDLLAEQGIGRVHEHTSNVTITGHSYWTPGIAACREYLGDEFTITDVDESVCLYWSREVTVERSGLGCTCDEIDRDMLTQHLPSHVADFEFEVECA